MENWQPAREAERTNAASVVGQQFRLGPATVIGQVFASTVRDPERLPNPPQRQPIEHTIFCCNNSILIVKFFLYFVYQVGLQKPNRLLDCIFKGARICRAVCLYNRLDSENDCAGVFLIIKLLFHIVYARLNTEIRYF